MHISELLTFTVVEKAISDGRQLLVRELSKKCIGHNVRCVICRDQTPLTGLSGPLPPARQIQVLTSHSFMYLFFSFYYHVNAPNNYCYDLCSLELVPHHPNLFLLLIYVFYTSTAIQVICIDWQRVEGIA